MKLWLDDVRDPKSMFFINQYGIQDLSDWTWVKTYDEAIALLKTGSITFASLDHDIGACQYCVDNMLHIGDMKTFETTFYNRCPHAKSGYDVVLWMEANNIWPKEGTKVHSMNPVGRKRMQDIIEGKYRMF